MVVREAKKKRRKIGGIGGERRRRRRRSKIEEEDKRKKEKRRKKNEERRKSKREKERLVGDRGKSESRGRFFFSPRQKKGGRRRSRKWYKSHSRKWSVILLCPKDIDLLRCSLFSLGFSKVLLMLLYETWSLVLYHLKGNELTERCKGGLEELLLRTRFGG